MSTCILTTTINVPILLEAYAANAREHGHRDVEFVVVGDLKTPDAAGDFCEQAEHEFGCRFTWFDIPRQQAYLRRFRALDRMLPWNSVQRRNVGMLYALEQGHEFIISIDDDNFLIPGSDFIGEHITGLGVAASQHVVSTNTGWFNCIGMMKTNFGVVYPRGYPMQRRWKTELITESEQVCRPVVNAGLWTGDPDIDALTRIYYPVETSLPLSHDYLTLAHRCWCPINSQNTVFHRSAAQAALMIVMGYELSGLEIYRYCDIWMSWFLRTIVDHLGDAVRFGRPVVHQNRNEHNLYKDLRGELPGMELNETLIASCQRAELTASTYRESYRQLAAHVERDLSGHPRAAFFRHLAEQMATWSDACERVGEREAALVAA